VQKVSSISKIFRKPRQVPRGEKNATAESQEKKAKVSIFILKGASFCLKATRFRRWRRKALKFKVVAWGGRNRGKRAIGIIQKKRPQGKKRIRPTLKGGEGEPAGSG